MAKNSKITKSLDTSQQGIEDIADKRWRKATKFDVALAGFGVFVFTLFIISVIINPENSQTKKLVFAVIWTLLIALQIRNFRVVLSKYQNGEDIRRGLFANVTEKRQKS